MTKIAKLTKNGNFLLFGDGDSGIGSGDGSTMVQNHMTFNQTFSHELGSERSERASE